jgi:hypothetical protein
MAENGDFYVAVDIGRPSGSAAAPPDRVCQFWRQFLQSREPPRNWLGTAAMATDPRLATAWVRVLSSRVRPASPPRAPLGLTLG